MAGPASASAAMLFSLRCSASSVQQAHVIGGGGGTGTPPGQQSAYRNQNLEIKAEAETSAVGHGVDGVKNEQLRLVVSGCYSLRDSRARDPQNILGSDAVNHQDSCMKGHLRKRANLGFKCKQCGKMFHAKAKMEEHLLCVHTSEGRFKCETCMRVFAEKRNLVEHIRTHTGKIPYQCDFCEERFDIKSSLVAHLKTHCDDDAPTVDAAEVKQDGAGQSAHTVHKPYQCDICTSRFTQKGHLVEHIRTHTGQRPFQCDICKQRFASKGTLVAHIRTHTGERPYNCDFCKQRFVVKSTLIKHIRTHTGERPFKCDNCNMRFSTRFNLTTHIRTHTGERPYQCESCKQRFTRKSYLVKHLKAHSCEKA